MYRSTISNNKNKLIKNFYFYINQFIIQKLIKIHQNKIFFITDSDFLAEEFYSIVNQKIKNVKIPITSYEYNDITSQKINLPINITYLGRASNEKGWKYIPFILRRYKNDLSYNFHIHCYSSDFQIDLNKFIKEFETYKNITFYFNPLSSKEYKNFLKNMNATFLFYDLERYKKQTSGVTIDCLTNMIYPLTFEKTWISYTLKKYQYGKILQSLDFDKNLINIYKALDDLPNDDLFMKKQSYDDFSKDYSFNSFYNNFKNAINNN